MGLLSQGRPLDWDETKRYAKYVGERGIAQFINIYHGSKDRADACFKWGDEVEYILVKFDHQKRVARVSLRAEEVFRRIDEQKRCTIGSPKSVWNPEFAAYMVEGTPANPYIGDGLLLSSLCDIEENMKFRRQEVESVLEDNETVMSLTSFPRLGCNDFTYPPSKPQPATSASGSLFFPDEAIYNGHPRFKTLVRNIRSRRRRKVIINLPIYRDTMTMDPYVESSLNEDDEARKASKPNHVYMDAMGFGMGCCCLQLTMQATHLDQAKLLYDQLAPMTPIALALSAASPIYRGLLTDRDCRWEVISSAVDDRTREESNETRDLKESPYRIPKSRYESISCYLSKNGQKYNDLPLVYNKNYYDLMVANKVDEAVARHIAHLFIRDPITLYKEKLEQTDEEMDHFENIQSTNWQTMRFKPPPSVDSPIGWRVEFRPFEAQTTDFENSAYVVFITLLSRVTLAYKLNFLMPLTLVDENMIEAQKRDAIRDSKFWFRSDILHRSSSTKGPLCTVLENCNNNNVATMTNAQNKMNCSSSNLCCGNNGSTQLGPILSTTPPPPSSTSHHSPSSRRLRSASNHRHHIDRHQHQHHHHLHHGHHHHLSHQHHQHLHQHRLSRQAAPSNMMDINTINTPPTGNNNNNNDNNNPCVKMTIDEIINGREGFVGVMPIVWHYVESLDDGNNSEMIMKIKRYLKLVSDRASLRIKTTARWMRDFVDAHPAYGQDSLINDEVAYDLLQLMDKIGKSQVMCPEMTGETIINGSANIAGTSQDPVAAQPRFRSHSSNGFSSSNASRSLSLSKRNNSP